MDDVKNRWMQRYKDQIRDGQMDRRSNRQILVGKGEERRVENPRVVGRNKTEVKYIYVSKDEND